MEWVVTYECQDCEETFDEVVNVDSGTPEMPCPKCKEMCGWVKLGGKPKSTRPFVNIAYPEHIRESLAMAVRPEDVPAAMKKYPGSTYNSRGHLIIHNRAEKLKRMKERNLIETN